MLVRHSLQYLLARGLPGLVNFVALAVYTRLLTPDEFGRYALILSGVGLVHVLVFQWLLLILARFLPREAERPARVLQPLLGLFLSLSALVATVGFALAVLWPTPGMTSLLALAVVLAITQAWHEVNLCLAAARFEPGRYGRQLGAKAVISLLTGAGLAWFGWGASAPVTGLILGSLLGWAIFSATAWKHHPPKWPAPAVLAEYSSYGLPLAITFALVWLTSSADRLIIGWLIDVSAAGYYAVGYDLAQQSLGLTLTIVNTAALPLAIRVFESKGKEAATKQLHQNGELIFVLAMSGAAALIAIRSQMMDLFVGRELRAGAGIVFPWIALTAAVAGIKSFHFDIAFHLSRQSRWLIVTSGLAAGLGLLLNLVLIPRYGIVGAAWASLSSSSLAATASAILGRKVFPMPNPTSLVSKGIIVAVSTSLSIHWATGLVASRELQLVFGLLFGGVAILLTSLLVNVADMRDTLMSSIQKKIIRNF